MDEHEGRCADGHGGTSTAVSAAAEKVAKWAGFLQGTRLAPAHPTLIKALGCFEREKSAVAAMAYDLGCGAGRDTFELLRRQWRVTAIDYHEDALAMLRQTLAQMDGGTAMESRLTCRLQGFEDLTLEPGSAGLVNASLALPFVPAAHVAAVWKQIVDALRPGGRFAGHFFGPSGTLVKRGTCTAVTRAEALARLEGFDIDLFEETEDDGPDGGGKTQHWHVFDVVARRR